MNAVQKVLNRKYRYGGETWTLGAIYADLQLVAASKLPHDRRGQRRMVEAYIAGLVRMQGEGIA